MYDAVIPEVDRVRGQFGAQTLHGVHHVRHFGIGQAKEEFLAPVAEDCVVFAQLAVKKADCLVQHRIAGLVTEFVVDPLEVVEIHHAHAAGGAASHHALMLLLQLVQQAVAVPHAGKMIHQAYLADNGGLQATHFQLEADGQVHERIVFVGGNRLPAISFA